MCEVLLHKMMSLYYWAREGLLLMDLKEDRERERETERTSKKMNIEAFVRF